MLENLKDLELGIKGASDKKEKDMFIDLLKDDIKEALTHMVTGPNIKKANVDFKDSGYWFKKGNIGKGFKDLGKGMLDII